MPNTNKKKKSSASIPWTQNQQALAHLMEEELQGLIEYLRTIHYVALTLIAASCVALIYALRVLFENSQHAIIAFIVIMVTAIGVILTSILVLRPWVLPRFLLPMDLASVNIDDLKALFQGPDEYLQLLHKHIQVLTDSFLLPKLRRLRHAITLLIFGISIALVLAIALP